ncbi:MAG TPA: hypothetical protein VJM32_06910 [Candidatus Saccharimonadales bacterium]|jgi:hypothetical protein|nr:hypothetical protein [Candidatus Saccharimonadales bacterium]
MDNPLLTPEHEQSELQKFKIHYEHIADNQTDDVPAKKARK